MRKRITMANDPQRGIKYLLICRTSQQINARTGMGKLRYNERTNTHERTNERTNARTNEQTQAHERTNARTHARTQVHERTNARTHARRRTNERTNERMQKRTVRTIKKYYLCCFILQFKRNHLTGQS